MVRFNPEMGDWFQEQVASHPGDDLPVTLTMLQVRKILLIISAGQRGHLVYQEATDKAVAFLETAANETLRDNGLIDIQMTRTAADIWRELDELPWPIPGPPQTQPDAQ